MTQETQFRIEKDSFGEIKVPAAALYGAQTARSLIYFNIGTETMPTRLIQAYAWIKKIAAAVNTDLKLLPENLSNFIQAACQEVMEGRWDAHFPLKIWQTGSGTQTNMNLNEVIANRAMALAQLNGQIIKIHPNDHVNCAQSSNDTFPTAMHIAAVLEIKAKLLPNLIQLTEVFKKKQLEFKDIIKVGRTHLQDAVPLTLGQEFSGYTALLERNIARITLVLDGLYDLAIGGTAVGTGLNAPKNFAPKFIERLRQETGFPFQEHPNKFAALSAHDEMVFASGALTSTACALMKIANDIRLLASGPHCGLGELSLPQNEPGSSIMPGKVNPTQCEAMTMVATQIMGNNNTIAIAGAQGQFELNTFKPAILHNFLHSVTLLSDAAHSFGEHCVQGIQAHTARLDQYLHESLALVTALNPHIGYAKAAEIAKKAYKDNIPLKQACLNLGYLSEAEFEEYVDPKKMLGPSS